MTIWSVLKLPKIAWPSPFNDKSLIVHFYLVNYATPFLYICTVAISKMRFHRKEKIAGDMNMHVVYWINWSFIYIVCQVIYK